MGTRHPALPLWLNSDVESLGIALPTPEVEYGMRGVRVAHRQTIARLWMTPGRKQEVVVVCLISWRIGAS